MADIPYTPEEAETAAEALRYWFRFDTWSVRQGLLLLVGIDPERVVGIEMPPDGSSLKVERKDFRPPGWFRIGFPPQIVQPLGNELMGRQPEITGFTFSGDVVMELMELMKLWVANPEFQGMTRLEPMRFVRFAESKGLAPYWLESARAKGIVPADPDRTPEKPATPPAGAQEADEVEKPEQRQREKPEQRQDRRLDWILRHGADHDGKKMTGQRGVLANLARTEKVEGRPMSDEKDIRADLKAAVARKKNAPKSMKKGSSVFNQ